MENFNIIGVHEKIQFLGGGVAKMGEGGDFEGGWYPNANYAKISKTTCTVTCTLIYNIWRKQRCPSMTFFKENFVIF